MCQNLAEGWLRVWLHAGFSVEEMSTLDDDGISPARYAKMNGFPEVEPDRFSVCVWKVKDPPKKVRLFFVCGDRWDRSTP